MAQTLAGKISIIVKGKLHGILDRQIEDSPDAYAQYVRELEQSKDEILDEAAIATARVDQTKGEIAKLTLLIQTDTSHAQLLVGDNDPENDGDAEKIMERVVENESALETLKQDMQSQQEDADALTDVANQLVRRHADMLHKLRSFTDRQRRVQTKERTAATLNAAAGVLDSAEGSSIDNLESRLSDRETVAGARLKNAMAKVPRLETSVTTSKAKALVAQMRANLKPSAATGT
jgi:phage shock protein A